MRDLPPRQSPPGSHVPHRRKRLWGGAAIFAIMGVVYGWIQSGSAFLDPDSFYHARMAALMAERGIVKPFPWLPFTTLADAFADHHFLYHLLLLPFVGTLGALAGTRAAAVLFAAAAITMFYVLLKSFNVPGAFLLALGLGCCGGFLVRLNLAKAPALSLCALMAAIIFIEKRRAGALFALSWLFVWLYGGWPVLVVVAAVYLGAGALLGKRAAASGRHPGSALPDRAPRASPTGPDLGPMPEPLARGAIGAIGSEIRCAMAVLAGLAAGLVVHPYFPQSLRFYWEQIVQIAVVGYAGRIEVGSEWYPYPPARLVAELGLVFLLPLVSLLVLLPIALARGEEGIQEDDERARAVGGRRGGRRAQEPALRPETWRAALSGLRRIFGREESAALVPALLMALFFLAMTLRNRRYVEYFAPFAMLVDALLLRALLARIRVAETLRRARAGMGKLAFLPALVLAYLALLLLFFPVRDVMAARAYYREAIPWTRFSKACAWLSGHTPEGSVVFHADFNDFPVLFFHDTRNRYINGLDATFLFRKNPEKYRIWADIASGRWKAAPANADGSESPGAARGPDGAPDRGARGGDVERGDSVRAFPAQAAGESAQTVRGPGQSPAGREPGGSSATGGVSEVILREFGARTVFIGKDHGAMRALVQADRSLQLVYEDEEAWIYQTSGREDASPAVSR